ncbi:unnamed protein product, partial [Laminaria digitata]
MTSFLCIIGTGTQTLMLFACLSQATSVCLLSFSSVRFFLPFCSGTRTRTHYDLPEPLMCVLLALLLGGRSSLSISYLDTHPPRPSRAVSGRLLLIRFRMVFPFMFFCFCLLFGTAYRLVRTMARHLPLAPFFLV